MWFDLDLKQNIACKDDMLKEFKKIQHEYNNMLQHIVCFIEAEDWEVLKEYKHQMLKKAQVLNSNNLTQLVKIKNIRILNLVYSLLIQANAQETTINLTIYTDIDNTNSYKPKSYKSLEHSINNAYEAAMLAGAPINLKITGNKEGICFALESPCPEKNPPNTPRSKQKDIFINTLIEKDILIQEILIMKNK